MHNNEYFWKWLTIYFFPLLLIDHPYMNISNHISQPIWTQYKYSFLNSFILTNQKFYFCWKLLCVYIGAYSSPDSRNIIDLWRMPAIIALSSLLSSTNLRVGTSSCHDFYAKGWNIRDRRNRDVFIPKYLTYFVWTYR